MMTDKRATPMRGTVRMVEWGTCAHCGKDVFRLAPTAQWWHQETGLTACAEQKS